MVNKSKLKIKSMGDLRWRMNIQISCNKATLLSLLVAQSYSSDIAASLPKIKSYVLMVQAAKDRPRFDAPSALNDPSNRRILA